MQTRNSPLRVAVIGCGRIAAQCHLPVLQALADIELVAVVDNNLDRLNSVAERFRVRRSYSDYRVMLNDAEVDVVAVCTPPQSHAEVGLAVLDAGKHLFMEKPLALSLNDADRLVDRAATAPGKALLGFNLRWHRLVRQVRRMIDHGGLGPLEMMHTAFTSKNGFLTQGCDWRRRHDLGGSVILDLGIHHFDLWRFLMRAEVETVSVQHRSDDVECATVSAMMGNGVLVTSSFSHGLSDTNEVEIHGRRGRLRMSCYRFDSLRVSQNSEPPGAVRDWLNGMIAVLRNVRQGAAQLRHGGDLVASYRAEWQHFTDAVRNDTPVQCSFEDARSTLRVALAAAESASRGQPVRVAQAAREITPIASATSMSRTAGHANK